MEDGRHTKDGRLDRAINGAVREMLNVEQRAGFRARVLRKIESDTVASGFSRKILGARSIPWIAVPLAAAAIVILAVMLPRESTTPKAPVTTTATNTQPATQPSVEPRTTPATEPRTTPAPPEPRPTSAPQRPAFVVARRAPGTTAPASSSGAERVVATSFTPAEPVNTEITPLKAIAPIEVAPVAPRALAQADIALRPLNPINELVIAPLTPPAGRD